jgi:hypothetical protein
MGKPSPQAPRLRAGRLLFWRGGCTNRAMVRFVILASALLVACGGGLSRDAVLTASVTAYRESGKAIAAHAPGSCPQVRAELEANRAAWAPVWAAVDASAPPLPYLFCDAGTGK